jgi:preprotein translocase subunit YajC
MISNALLGPIFMYGAIFAIFYFILIRPGQQQRKQHEAMIRALRKGDEIVTAGGIVGEVLSVKETASTDPKYRGAEDRIIIKSLDTRLIVERGRITRVTKSTGQSPTPAATE